MKTSISVEISPGELIDKITILEIKLERIEDADKLANVKLDWETLSAARDAAIEPSGELERLSRELKEANERLWEIEDDIRDRERNKTSAMPSSSWPAVFTRPTINAQP